MILNKFRGKSINKPEWKDDIDEQGWIYGSLIGEDVIVGDIIEFNDEYFNTEFWYKVDPKTVGRFIGLKDKLTKEIYEDDIFDLEEDGLKGVVKYCSAEAKFKIEIYGVDEYWNGLYDETRSGLLEVVDFDNYIYHETFCFTVIGNIHDNPELLQTSH